ncbi:CidA/LrgA family protein [Duffyella gerundensis]|uniref:CidA/LrgA family protein n=1 Tax=Duffyella gerundensis TaxID=1619313 RepID=UPI001654944B|nr:CidA/LrgA family protein [Duffyella gerundensis]
MRPALTICWHYLRAFIIIYLCLFAGNGLAALLPITIPGSILGMLVLFTLLTVQIIPVKWVKPGCHIIIRNMALLFVPISVGVMSYTDILTAQFGPIVVSCIVSTILVIVIVGVGSQRLHAELGEKP